MKTLEELTVKEYRAVRISGMLWEAYPEATGDYNQDLQAVVVHEEPIEENLGQFCGGWVDTGKKRYYYDIIDE